MTSKTERLIAIWIDHREAIVVIFSGDHLETEEEFFSEAGAHTHGGGWSQHRLEAHRHEMLKHFYEEVVEHLGEADKLLLYGPGQAKHELRRQIEQHKGLRGLVVAVKGAPPLTPEKLASRAEAYFGLSSIEQG